MTEHVPVTREDTAEDNPQFLAHSLRALQREVRSGFEFMAETFGNKILATMERVETRLDDFALRISHLERAQLSTNDRLAALETVTRRPARQKKAK